MKTNKDKSNSAGSNPEKSFEAGRKGGSSPIDTANKTSNQVNNSKPTGLQNQQKKKEDTQGKQKPNFTD